MTINEAIDKSEDALWGDPDEPGMRDTEDGLLLITEIGMIRLRKILTEFRNGKKRKK